MKWAQAHTTVWVWLILSVIGSSGNPTLSFPYLSPDTATYRGDNLRRLDAAAWSNPRYQPIGSRLREELNWEQKDLSLSLSFSFSLFLCFADREAAAIAMQATTKTSTTYNPRGIDSTLRENKSLALRHFAISDRLAILYRDPFDK